MSYTQQLPSSCLNSHCLCVSFCYHIVQSHHVSPPLRLLQAETSVPFLLAQLLLVFLLLTLVLPLGAAPFPSSNGEQLGGWNGATPSPLDQSRWVALGTKDSMPNK